MKKILSIMLTLALSLSLCACSKPEEEPSGGNINPAPPISGIEPSENGKDPEKPEDPEKNPTPSVSDAGKSLSSVRDSAKNRAVSLIYLGYSEDGTLQSVKNAVAAAKLTSKYTFIGKIPDNKIVLVGGGDIYCIIPTKDDAKVTVKPIDYDEDGGEVIGNAVYSGGAEPIILVCNVSDIMENSLVEVVSSNKTTSFSPYISLKDGTTVTTAPDGEVNIISD